MKRKIISLIFAVLIVAFAGCGSQDSGADVVTPTPKSVDTPSPTLMPTPAPTLEPKESESISVKKDDDPLYSFIETNLEYDISDVTVIKKDGGYIVVIYVVGDSDILQKLCVDSVELIEPYAEENGLSIILINPIVRSENGDFFGWSTNGTLYTNTKNPVAEGVSVESIDAELNDFLNSSALASKSDAENTESPSENDDAQETIATPVETVTLGQKNALSAAKQYLSIMPFSRSGLIDQLEFEGYSTEEATYGADHCNADWNEQAAKTAKQYLDIMSFSRQGLIDQLKYEGFTTEQAEYGVSAVGY